MSKKPLILMILDGWGINSDKENNAVALAMTPNMDRLLATYPNTQISTSGMAVGLPHGQMGNSEVGHLNLGAGRVVYQDLTRISKAIDDGELSQNKVLCDCIAKTRAGSGRLHLAGLLSDGGVHSHNTHLYGLIKMAKKQGINEIFIHCIMDGRDTPPKSGAAYIDQLETEIAKIGAGRIATVIGRYYAMDRDNRWDRVEKAYRAIVSGIGEKGSSGRAAVVNSYRAELTDEFILPTVIDDVDGRVMDGDGFIFYNFRSDRAREISRAIALKDFDGFDRGTPPGLAGYVCMTEYDATFGLPIAFGPESLNNILGELLAKSGRRQLRIAETEKYAHVTFFFNGGVEEPFTGEDRSLIPSPKDVATYDQKPEMSAYLVTDELIHRLDMDCYDVIILNLANCDMVGHTGNLTAAIKAVEAVDRCVGRITEKIIEKGGTALITADHGNAEQMADEAGGPFTAHTCNPVRLILVDDSRKECTLREGGRLADIAPTILAILGIDQPGDMSGNNLLGK